MLQTIRDRASGWFAYAIIFLISIPFALWGINHYLDGGGTQNVALVGGQPITIRTFERSYRQEQLRLSELFGGKLPDNLDNKTIKQAVLRQLIQEAVLTENLVGSGYKISDKQLVRQIMGYPIFQVNGSFSNNKYHQVLADQGLSPANFENMLRKQLLIQQFQSGIYASAFTTKQQRGWVVKLLGEEREVGMMVIPTSKFINSIVVKPSEIKKYYQAHANQFMTNEKVNVSYIRLSEKHLQSLIKPSVDELQNYYESHRKAYAIPNRVRYSEIVLDAPKIASEKDKLSSFVNQIRQLSASNGDIKHLATEISHKMKLRLGSVKINNVGERTDFPNVIEKALYKLKVGSISNPVEYDGKWYVLKLNSILTYDYLKYNKVKDLVQKDYLAEASKTQYENSIQRLSELAYEHPGSLQAASKALDLKIKQTGWFEKTGGSGIATNPKVVKAAFTKAVLDEGANSSLIELGAGDAVVIRVTGKKLPTVKPLTEVEDKINGLLVRRYATDEASKLAKNIEKDLTNGQSAQLVASKYQLRYRNLGWVRRDASIVPNAILNAAFKLGTPSSSDKPLVTATSLGAGNYAVVEVNKVRLPDDNAAQSKSTTAPTKNVLAQQLKNQMAVVLQALQESTEIKIYPSNLNY
ncbi:SurA N-terminal domain-containing protein [Acidihalobacter aeolianus]|nr:SurA N-terminal domain-containing protein [Acidihalobacter aeolianus]